MKPFELFAVLTAGIVALIVAVPLTEQKPIPAQVIRFESAGPLIRERVVELPEDGDAWHTVLILEDGEKKSAATRNLASLMATTPRLESLVAQTHYHEFPPDHWWVRRYAASQPKPAIWVMTDSARVIYKASGSEVPTDGEVLADEIQRRIEDCCPNRPNRPDRQPVRPDKQPDGQVNGIPDLRPGGRDSSGGGANKEQMLTLALAGAGLVIVYLLAKKS